MSWQRPIAPRRPQGDLDAKAASSTMDGDEDGHMLHRPACRVSYLDLPAPGGVARRAPGGPRERLSPGADAGPAARLP
jgi:hypothetical protein